MKLRIKENTVRLRLTRTEVAHFGKEGMIKESICFGAEPAHHFNYEIRIEENASTLDITYQDQTICVSVPGTIAERWVKTDEVGFEQEVDTGGVQIHVLVEKDFQCLHRDNAEEPDNYSHPMAE
ncbi:hypothetical protein FNH22_25340 [Fulvivirga sp. M361]|uniref:DUF7009 family protein n=1 Tax=Fulvivirga sp. M361 TaxID=2594266 RepID=UPI00117A7FC4|nr:hypothetical protein [Fulvivirga sp. M361]TRX50649.1 hypothetical protein FNH22_25340 [Fulvivirga sp. M361]